MQIVINLSSHGTKTLIFSFSLFFCGFTSSACVFFHFYQMKTLDEPTLSCSINKGRQIIYTEPATGTLKNQNKTLGYFYKVLFMSTGNLQVASVLSLVRMHTGLVAHQTGANPSFCSTRGLEVFPLPSGWDAGLLQGYSQH